MYSHEESAERALSRLGEDWYDILLNNCEHFVSWCILGIHHSQQVNRVVIAAVAANALLKESVERTIVQKLAAGVGKEATAATVGVAAGMTAGSGLVASAGVTTALAGLAATSAAPLAAALLAGTTVGLGVKKIADWLSGE